MILILVFFVFIFFIFKFALGTRGGKTVSAGKKVVVITGCDSGVGFAAAEQAYNAGFTVVASCLNDNSEGAKALKEKDPGKVFVVRCDVTKKEDVDELHRVTKTLLERNKYDLHAVLSNAGVLVFGEFLWQTEDQLVSQVQVNTIGHLRFLKKFLPDIIKYKGRIISVSSTCGSWVLPGLSLYAASKYAAEAICRGIRIEMNRFGVKVVNINPGELADQTNILGNQKRHADAMKSNVLPGDEDYFEHFHRHLTSNFNEQPHNAVKREGVLQMIRSSLLDAEPSSYYSDATVAFRLFLMVYKILPGKIADSLLRRVMKNQIGYDPDTKTKI